MDHEDLTFGERLRARRSEAGLTQRELARRANVSVRTVRYIEQGHIRNPRPASIQQLASVLDLPLHNADPSDAEKSPSAVFTINVLGPLAVYDEGRRVSLGETVRARLLALLALQPNTAVSRDEIIDVLWGEQPPRSHVNLVHTYVARLRRLFASTGRQNGLPRLINARGGYLLEVDGDHLDLVRFTELAAHGRESYRAGDPEAACDSYARGLSCWRGAILSDLDQDLRQHPAAVAVSRERLAAVLDYADIAIALGRHDEAVVRLREVAAEEPLHEGLQARLMIALAGTGQQAAALRLFDELRDRLGDEMGIEPSAELQSAQLRVLRQQIPVAEAGDDQAPMAPGRNFLPYDIEDFTGRSAEVDRLLQLASAQEDSGRPAASIIAVDGMPGVGKTTLVVHVAHRIAQRYPDAQLFLDLQGHTEGHPPRTPRDALDSLLRQLGIAGELVPEGVDDCAALWRGTLADRRALIVLDNAADPGQLRPILPGAKTCLTLITSRERLSSLEGVERISLDVLPPDDANALFTRIVGAERTVAHGSAVGEALSLCGFLPLAIRIAAARLRDRSAWTPVTLAARLRDKNRRLIELSVGDRSAYAAFALSYQQLTPRQQRIFRLLGEHPGFDINAYTAAALCDITPDEAELVLEQLVDMHLLRQTGLAETGSVRYCFHDLLRYYARALSSGERAESDRRAALTRLLDYYLHTADLAAQLLEPFRHTAPVTGIQPSAHIPVLSGQPAAMAWLDTERANLAAVIATANEYGWAAHCWQLTQRLWRFYFVRGHLHDWITTHLIALRSAEQLGEIAAQAELHKNLGLAYFRSGAFADAWEHHRYALDLDRETGDLQGEAKTRNQLGFIRSRAGHYEEALDDHQQSAALYRRIGDRCGEARSMIGLGEAYFFAGRYAESMARFQEALTLSREVRDRWGENFALIGLGFTAKHMAQGADAGKYLEEALALARSAGDRWCESVALTGLGYVHQGAGAAADAIRHCEQAVALADEVGDRWGARLALSALANLYHEMGRPIEALRYHQRALELARALGNPNVEAEILAALDAIESELRDHPLARRRN
ncbi:DNA-binding SARP family transcriptional activator [Nocardia tenerifensis]|uniref:DNA-binding SARP family transcriptional activator n=1 Tax=Nocardia tenerifensis TaxID=228006 RepID=A0A318JN95_9NOCA|nr:BTAD domain-containing putative transcriptional regulator [Nocardia tenerifensis]PXX56321.1 DNA-binding SARP family transcriptional activator [Nocardia tenerifensis]